MLPTELKLLRSMNSFCRELITFLLDSTGIRIWTDSVMHPQSFNREHNTNASVAVTVEYLLNLFSSTQAVKLLRVTHTDYLGEPVPETIWILLSKRQ